MYKSVPKVFGINCANEDEQRLNAGLKKRKNNPHHSFANYIAISFTLFIICTPCTNAAPPFMAAAMCTASIIWASL